MTGGLEKIGRELKDEGNDLLDVKNCKTHTLSKVYVCQLAATRPNFS